mmetsp:Transcript_51748/g.70554  ORF Transcript_51748/g.70554 Transcript_51748/m.70554 type:complete len:85 (+) Transcript_51748:139-393(+)
MQHSMQHSTPHTHWLHVAHGINGGWLRFGPSFGLLGCMCLLPTSDQLQQEAGARIHEEKMRWGSISRSRASMQGRKDEEEGGGF